MKLDCILTKGDVKRLRLGARRQSDLENRSAIFKGAWVAPKVNCIQWKQGLSADVGVSHSFFWPSKPWVSSETLDEAVHKYLTGIKK